MLVSINLRASITAVGPVVSDIRADLGLSNAAVGLLTTLPVLAFAGASPLAGPLSRRIGIERTLGSALVLLLAGILLRVTGTTWAAFLGTAMLGVAIAAGNVLLPALVKRDQPTPHRAGHEHLRHASWSGSRRSRRRSRCRSPTTLGLGWQGALAVWGSRWSRA